LVYFEKGEGDTHNLAVWPVIVQQAIFMPLAYGYPPASACISRYSNNIYIFYKVCEYTCIRDKSLFDTEDWKPLGEAVHMHNDYM